MDPDKAAFLAEYRDLVHRHGLGLQSEGPRSQDRRRPRRAGGVSYYRIACECGRTWSSASLVAVAPKVAAHQRQHHHTVTVTVKDSE